MISYTYFIDYRKQLMDNSYDWHTGTWSRNERVSVVSSIDKIGI